MLRLWYVSTFSRPVPEFGEADLGATELYPRFVDSNDVVIEVGARIGKGTMELARLAKKVYSFEPYPPNFRMLKAYTRRFRNVKVFEIAVGNVEGIAELKVAGNDVFSSVSSVRGLHGREYRQSVSVKTKKLDSVEFEERPTVLISDCEGEESEVLKGAHKTLAPIRCVLIETHRVANDLDTREEVVSILKAEGFTKIVDQGLDGPASRWMSAER